MTMNFKTTAFALALSLPLFALPLSAHSAGDSGDTDTSAVTKCEKDMKWSIMQKKCVEKGARLVVKCFGAKVWDESAKKCIKKKDKSTSIAPDAIYTYGRSLARAGKYEDAIRVLHLVPNQDDPRVLNYLGYSNRKLGNMDVALGYYQKAVAANPDFTLVREYLGEAYIQLGLLEKAREQLTQIERICGTKDCREYAMLTKYMVDHQIQ